MEMEKKSSSSSFGNGSKILGARRRGDSYHLDLVLLPLFFFTIPSRFFSYQSRIEHAEKNLLHVKTVRFRSGKRILGNHVLWLESVVNPISDRSS